MKCMTMLHECVRQSTPQKSGNNMKEEKKELMKHQSIIINDCMQSMSRKGNAVLVSLAV